MKLIIFAGGHGTRLWPLSRKNSPKQFEKFFDGKSTIQLAVERVQDVFGIENVHISTNENFKQLIKEQIPELPEENYFLEPAKRDLAGAVGLSFMKLRKSGYTGPVAILWADHLMEKADEFQKALSLGEEMIIENPNRFIFLGEKPRFANHNLGWITVGKQIEKRNDFKVSEFVSWHYRPELTLCKEMFESGNSFWNPGYFVTSIDFVLQMYKEHMKDMYASLEEMIDDEKKTNDMYPQLESISFDDAILHKTAPEQASVIHVDMEWSDPGTLYALKEALQTSPDANVTKGETFEYESKDCLVVNYEEDKIVTTVGLDGIVVINMNDALVVVHKDNVPMVKKLVGELERNGLKKYI